MVAKSAIVIILVIICTTLTIAAIKSLLSRARAILIPTKADRISDEPEPIG
jgi:hypothetical protein